LKNREIWEEIFTGEAMKWKPLPLPHLNALVVKYIIKALCCPTFLRGVYSTFSPKLSVHSIILSRAKFGKINDLTHFFGYWGPNDSFKGELNFQWSCFQYRENINGFKRVKDLTGP